MSTGSDSIDKRAIELGCHLDCLNREAVEVRDDHPDCYNAVMRAFDEVYGDVPQDRVRLRMINDGFRPYR